MGEVDGLFKYGVGALCAPSEKSMHEVDRHRALADCGRNTFDAAGPRVTDRKYAGDTGLKQKGRTAQRPLKIVTPGKVRAGNNEALIVQDK